MSDMFGSGASGSFSSSDSFGSSGSFDSSGSFGSSRHFDSFGSSGHSDSFDIFYSPFYSGIPGNTYHQDSWMDTENFPETTNVFNPNNPLNIHNQDTTDGLSINKHRNIHNDAGSYRSV